MIARQAHVEQTVLDQLTYDTSEDEMGQILRFFHGTGTCCKRFGSCVLCIRTHGWYERCLSGLKGLGDVVWHPLFRVSPCRPLQA